LRVYLSAKFERQNEMQLYSEQLRAEGIEVLSAWTDIDSPSSDGFTGIVPSERALRAMMDLQQVAGTNALVQFTEQHGECPTTGRRWGDGNGSEGVEFGVALALGKRLLVVGPVRNGFHDMPDVERFAGWPECFHRILALRESDGMTTRQAAREAGLTRQDIQGMISSGELPAVKRSGRWVIGRNHLDQVKARRRRAEADAREQA
jgi:Helix-turn-helix domain